MKHALAALTILFALSAAADNAQRALSRIPMEAAPGIAALRAEGQAGVDALVAAGARLNDPQDIERFHLALDRVCKQRDCYASHLYWYTDFKEAQAAARAGSRPILALHLLGNLDDELSCANSRFFRTTLYSNPDVAAYMREHFVLYWVSERPVPKITIDFGDGRKIQQTITGNSVHYLLDADGNPLDVLPGLYSPTAFLAQLQQMQQLAHEYASAPGSDRILYLRQYHARQYNTLTGERNAEAMGQAPPPRQAFFTAAQASARARSKMGIERPFLAVIGLPVQDGPDWKQMAARHASEVVFHPATLALMEKKSGKPISAKMLANLQQSVAEDTLRNEYDIHRQIHEWLADSQPTADALNARIYAELFLTPANDPWLGLLQPDTYNALQSAAGGQ